VLVASGQEQDGLALLEQIRDRSKARGDWESHAKAWIELGSIAWNQGRWALAMQRWRRALEVAESNGYPRSAAMAALGLARAYLERGEVDSAADMLNGRTVDPPRDLAADLANTHAEVLLRQGRLDQAASTLQRGLQLAPATADQAGLRSALARIHGAQGRFDAAWTDWEAAFALAENTEARRAIYLDGLDIAVRQDGETLREDGRIEALWRRIREDPERPSVRALSYALAERLWESDPEGASLVHFVTMTEDLTKDSLDSYIADGLHLFRRLVEHPTCDGFGESVQRRVTLHEVESGTRPPDEKLLWPFRMAERYRSSTEASATPTGDQIIALFEAVWMESAPERASPEETSD